MGTFIAIVDGQKLHKNEKLPVILVGFVLF